MRLLLLLPLPALLFHLLLLSEPKRWIFYFLDFIYHLLANNTFPKMKVNLVSYLQEWELWECQNQKFMITDQCFELQLEMPEQAMLLLPLYPGFCTILVNGWRCCPCIHAVACLLLQGHLPFAVLSARLRTCPSAVGLAQVRWWTLGFACCDGGRMGWWNWWEGSRDMYNLEVCTKKNSKSLLLCPPVVTVIAVDTKGWRSQANNAVVICFKSLCKFQAYLACWAMCIAIHCKSTTSNPGSFFHSPLHLFWLPAAPYQCAGRHVGDSRVMLYSAPAHQWMECVGAKASRVLACVHSKLLGAIAQQSWVVFLSCLLRTNSRDVINLPKQ